MKKLKSSLSAKIIAMILLCAMGALVILSGAVVVNDYFKGVYSTNYTEYYNGILQGVAGREIRNKFNPYDEFWYENDNKSEQNSNFRYNVYELLPDGKEKPVHEGLEKGQKTICKTSLYYINTRFKNGDGYSDGLYENNTYGSVARNMKDNEDLEYIRGFRIDGYVLPLTANDPIYQTAKTAELFYNLRYDAMIACGISLIMFIILFCFLMASAGHKKGEEEIYLNCIAKIPFDLLTAAVAALVLGCILFGFAIVLSFNTLITIIGISAGTAAAVFVAAVYCMSLAARIKKGGFVDGVWKSFLLYKLWMWLWGWVKKLLKGCLKYIKLFFQYLPASIRPMAVVAALMLIDIIFLSINSYETDNQMIWLIITRILALGGILYLLTCFKKINEGMKKIAENGESCEINTKYLYGPLKEQAENLSNISDGIKTAVAEKMKSERFRTELITNVSHDIKTPLTSIVNYIDLLEKEEPENEKIKEYLEVLSRQSAKLKKLIDDLVEASKASSGSLPVNPERLELGVLVGQTAGEYSEKLDSKGLQLIVTKPEEKLEILADGRHMWRIFDNLMNNIFKYAMPGTRVYLDMEKKESYAIISFRNISKERLNISADELAERFVRGDSSRNTDGSGLGLSIAQSLTALQEGEMDIKLDGDLFKVTLKFKTL